MNPFIQLGVSPELVAAVETLGFENPTPIQENAIPVLLDTNKDFIGLASTGTGKTAAFGLPLLQQIHAENRQTQGLILAPTRELCNQIAKDLQSYAVNLPAISVVPVYGGASIENQIRDLRRGAQIIVATPGRLIDLIERGAAKINDVDIVVLDEADEMLNMGFKDDIDTILENVWNDNRRTWLFSATMPAEVRAISKKFMDNPFELTMGTTNAANTNISHEFYLVRAKDRYEALKRVVDLNPDIFGIVFTRTKIEAQEIAEKLIKDGYDADSLHGDLSQAQRDKVMNRFRERSLQILVATDVAARGIDVDNVTHVINYGLPDELEVYTHRSGRTARAGKKGISISIVHAKENGRIRQLEKFTKATFIKKEVPTGKEICERQLFSLVEKVHKVEVNEEEIAGYLPHIYNELSELTKEDIIKKFVSIEFNRFLSYYENAGDLNFKEGERQERNDRSNMERIFISLGELDRVDKQGMLKFINSLQLGRIEVGRIDIKRSFSFVQIESSMANEFLDAVNNWTYEGRDLRAERAGERDGGGDDFKKKKKRPFKDRGGRNESRPAGKSEGSKSYGKDFYFPDFDSAHKKERKKAKATESSGPKKNKKKRPF
ncbi:MAG: DEAD/DEAH box helicase [Bacteroidota bacterium]|nr:DEAD/DEAH box helicase [Bacteroidota bacterium]MDX5431565.1 DEAD/DEAH box helicase [Bacteroidota bacterium]MDX5470286.1 DEAD/DEAH box helicase [Bacteroidota bacterium]